MVSPEQLTSFFQRAAAAKFRFGEWDCAMTLANWVREQTGVDPAPQLRGTYRTEYGWARVVVREGGLVALVHHLATSAGLTLVSEYQAGDVAIIDVPSVGESGAIRSARRWVMKFAGGLLAADLNPLVAWGMR